MPQVSKKQVVVEDNYGSELTLHVTVTIRDVDTAQPGPSRSLMSQAAQFLSQVEDFALVMPSATEEE